MKGVISAVKEVWGLFVDDGSLALGLVIWCAAAGLGLTYVVPSKTWRAPILFIGCLAILLANVAATVRRRHMP